MDSTESQHAARLQARMGGPLFVRPRSAPAHPSSSSSSALGVVPEEPLQLALLRLGKHRLQQGLRKTVTELARRGGGRLRGAVEALEEALCWAQQKQAISHFSDFAADELAAVQLCGLGEPDFVLRMNEALLRYQLGGPVDEEARLWENFAATASAGLAKLRRSRGEAPPARSFRVAWVPRAQWEEHFQGGEGRAVCFAGAQSATAQEQWDFLATPAQGCIPCVLEFDESLARQAANLQHVSASSVAEELMLPPYTWGIVTQIRTEQGPDAVGLEVRRVVLRARRCLDPLPEVLEASAESTLAAALLIGLNASSPEAESLLFGGVIGCFHALASAAEVKNLEAVQTVWKGYWECLLEGCHSWKEINETAFSGVVSAARVAVLDLALAARGVTKRALRCESCMNHTVMEEQRSQLREEVERLKEGAVAVARDQVSSLQLETLTDPEAFLRFIQHDPIKAFEVAPAAARAYVAAEPAQRVLLFAKLMGLVAMAGGLLSGDAKVHAAFDSPMPLQEDPWQVLLADRGAAAPAEALSDRQRAARSAVSCLQSQRMVLARTRLLIAGGAPDVGKTTFLREVFGLRHLTAGLSRSQRTEQITFALHPDGDEQCCPAYMVDTPGFGDGECLYRNDMGRLLLGAGSWIPGGVTLLWVVKAGRNVRQEADEFLRTMAAPRLAVLAVVTHVDKLFEERYREVGPQWRDGPLKGVPKDDPRWAKQRSAFMAELKDEVASGVASIVGGERAPEMVYACLGGWMASSEAEEDEDDEFAARPPWPWAQRELTAAFGIKSKNELRRWLDDRLGL